MQNTNILYGVIGLLLGLLIAGGSCFMNHHRGNMGMNTEMKHDMNNMQGTMNGMLGNLSEKTGDDFDKEFIEEMIVHHQGAVEMAQLVLETSKRPELLKLANDIISAQTKEIKMMEEWQKAWFN